MKTGKRYLCALSSALCFASAVALGADLNISASLDRSQIAMGEQAVMSVTISGNVSNVPDPQMPGLPAFQIQNAGTSESHSWVNGQASASVTHTYVLTPKQEGAFTIPPVRLTVEGRVLETTPMSLTVVKGNAAALPPQATPGAAPQEAPPAFVAASVDKSSAYVGEQVTFSFRLYNRAAFMQQPQYQPPDTSGFWTEDLPPQRNFNASVKGVPYQVVEVRTALFPTHPGKATVGPATLGIQIQNFSTDPFSFFSGGQARTLRSDPIAVQVKPLPAPAPAGFHGAVGEYRLTAELDKPSGTAGQPLTLTVTITGRGNIKSLPQIELPQMANFRTFDANAATNIEKKDYRVQGSKVFKTVLIPNTPGDLTIPPVSFTYFDPAAGSYKKLATQPLTVHVKPGAPGAGAPSLPGSSGGAQRPEIRVLNEDIRYIKTPSGIASQGGPLYRSKTFRWVNGLALLAFLSSVILPMYRRLFLSNPAMMRFRSARSRALALIQGADARTLSQALQVYLIDKLGLGNGISLRSVQDSLQARGVSTAGAAKVKELWDLFDLFQFAPAQVRPDELEAGAKSLRDLIAVLEKEIKWES